MAAAGRKCGVGNHPLRDPVLVPNPQHVAFIRKILKDFRPDCEICGPCLGAIEKVYNRIRRPRYLDKLKTRPVSPTKPSTSTDHQSVDTFVFKKPCNKQLKVLSKRPQSKGSQAKNINNNGRISSSVTESLNTEFTSNSITESNDPGN